MFAIKELYVVLTITTMIASGIMFWLHFSKFSAQGVLCWAFGMSTIATGQLLLILRGYIPFFFSIVVANVITLIGVFLIWIGIRKFAQIHTPIKLYALGIVITSIATVLLYWFSAVHANTASRVAAFSTLIIPYTVGTAHTLFKYFRQYQSAYFLGVFSILTTLMYIARAISGFTTKWLPNYFNSDWGTFTYSIWVIAYVLIVSLSLLKLTIEHKQLPTVHSD